MPGVRTRWDDFVAIHAANNEPIHESPFLLPWHRQFLADMERALRQECGYRYSVPYLDFTRYINTPTEQWPVFDNSNTSLSGNGVPTQDGCSCIPLGPLKNWVVDLGPAGEEGRCRPTNGLGLNPHCLERRFNIGELEFLTEQMVLNLTFSNDSERSFPPMVESMLADKDAADFMPALEVAPNYMHGSMHNFVGGLQIFTRVSPGDSLFFCSMHGWISYGQSGRAWVPAQDTMMSHQQSDM